MFLKYRPARPSDIPAMLALASDRAWYTPQDTLALGQLWQSLLASGAANAWVMEDALAPAHACLMHFGITVFAAEEFADAILSLPPGLGLQVLRAHQAGQSPLLSLPQMRTANAGAGMTWLYPWFGAREGVLTSDWGSPVRDHLLNVGVFLILGYRLTRYFSTANSVAEREWGIGAGGNVLAEHGPATWLLGLTREEGLRRLGTLAETVFTYRAPRFAFTPGEQCLLLHALSGATDEELADDLNMAIVTVRKRWSSIYGRVCDVLPELLTDDADMAGVRGVEKKRPLLLYLRQHLEELRPYCARTHHE